jgi:hypothetical protein
MNIKVTGMGNGVPDIFKGSPIRSGKPAGRLKEQSANIQKMQSANRQTIQKSQSEVKQFAKTPKGNLG